jgi:two-component system, cell cycle response regulator
MDTTFREVLLVDDDPQVHHILANMLTPAGFKIQHAANGAEALDMVREECPYFVVTDWSMLPVDGIELCQFLRKESLPHYVYIVLLTAKSRSDDIVTGLNAGADDFVTKPVNRGELLARLQAGARVLELERRLSELARSDPLTGLLNRGTFHELLEMEWSRSIRYGHPLTCVMLDVDFFKRINDTSGHLAGDNVLKTLAKTLQSVCRQADYVGRYGGDEFCILLSETDEQGALVWAERCRSAIAATVFGSGARRFAMTASFGVAERSPSMDIAEHLLECADHALLAAEQGGKDRVLAFGSMAPSKLLLAGAMSANPMESGSEHVTV